MPSIIDQIDSFSFDNTKLFFDETRLGKEVRLNLASFSGSGSGSTSDRINQLIRVLEMAIARMELALGSLLNGRRAIFYMWHDGPANLLRWSIISDLGQKNLPFCSNVKEVDLDTVVKEWTAPVDDSGLLAMSKIEQMTSTELRNISRATGIPTINAYVRRLP
jgi:hypothetical protein